MKGSLRVSENFFSIVMVGYNSKEWINRAVESVLAQNYKNFEIVAVDALTDDGT
jgi:glycosyltransferase involved in cell wall biosynthesis